MTSGDGRIPRSSGAGSDDEISVIAVIKKGTSGIPKRARYHYIRELPLTSVKSFKESLQKGKEILPPRRGRGLLPMTGSIVENYSKIDENHRVINGVKKPRVIELSDEISKMELRREFKMSENDNLEEDNEEQFSNSGSSSSLNPTGSNVVHKLPPGTVLIKQEPRTPKCDDKSASNPPEANETGNKANENSARTTATNTSNSNTNSSGTSSASSVISSGSGNSSGGLRSGSPSPLPKVKRIHRAAKGGSRRKTKVEIVPRRNPKRCGSKKGGTMREVAMPTTSMITRPRQRRLLAVGRQERNEGRSITVTGTNRRNKMTTMPYMNTRSVTRKLYTVGATYQAPTKKDETEWRDWPVHGMHERPVFHPQVGLAAGCAGRVFWSTTDAEGLNWSYREILDGPEEVEIVPVDPGQNRTQLTPSPIKRKLESTGVEKSFEVCMHESLHSVLGYCAQIMRPGYRDNVEKNGKNDGSLRDELPSSCGKLLSQERKKDAEDKRKEVAGIIDEDGKSSGINISQLEDSSISDETLMEISSIYKKLLPVEDQPSSSREGSPSASANTTAIINCSINSYTGIKNQSSCNKSSNETSEIARILSEYNESLKETSDVNRPFSSTAPRTSFTMGCGQSPEDYRKAEVSGDKNDLDENSRDINNRRDDHWLEELLLDTSLLYCIATGVHQHDLTKYFDTLDAKQSLQWLKHRGG